MFENVEYEWNLSDDNFTDMSDDEEIIKVGLSICYLLVLRFAILCSSYVCVEVLMCCLSPEYKEKCMDHKF